MQRLLNEVLLEGATEGFLKMLTSGNASSFFLSLAGNCVAGAGHTFLPGKHDQTVAFIFSLCIAAKFRFHDFEVLPVGFVERVTANR